MSPTRSDVIDENKSFENRDIGNFDLNFSINDIDSDVDMFS